MNREFHVYLTVQNISFFIYGLHVTFVRKGLEGAGATAPLG